MGATSKPVLTRRIRQGGAKKLLYHNPLKLGEQADFSEKKIPQKKKKSTRKICLFHLSQTRKISSWFYLEQENISSI